MIHASPNDHLVVSHRSPSHSWFWGNGNLCSRIHQGTSTRDRLAYGVLCVDRDALIDRTTPSSTATVSFEKR